MARANLNQTSFTAGVLSPRVLGRVDIDRYFQGLKSASNGYAVPQGGFRRRPGTIKAAAADGSGDNASILVPFVVGRDQAWHLEFGEQKIKVYAKDGTYTGVTLTAPYYASHLSDLDWAQSDTTLYLFHPLWPIHRVQLLDGSAWSLDEAPLTTQPFVERGHHASGVLTLSAATVGTGRALTSPPSFTFLPADVGRAMTCSSGIAVITAYTSASQVTVTITRAFPSVSPSALWRIDSSPQTDLTPSAAGPVGTGITLTLATGGWRTADVGSMVRVNGGLCRITSYSSTTVVNATVIRELSGTTAAPALSWSAEPAAWNAIDGYPRTGTIYQQRLIVGGTSRWPRTVWGSRLGETLDFELGTTDDLAFSFTIDSDEASAISYITSSPDLLVLTESGEYSMKGGVEKPITPTNIRIRQESGHGAAKVRPIFATGECLFVQRAGRKVRSMAYRYDFDRYSAPDITSLSEHLTRAGVVCIAWQQEPDPLMWAVLGDGTFLSCTLDRDQQPSVVGWFPHATDGFVEWMSVIPTGDRDELWAIVRRSSGRYIERFDDTIEALHDNDVASGATNPIYGMTVDCGVVVTNASGVTTVSAPHLVGKTVDIVADGLVMPAQVVPAGGTVTLTRSAKKVQLGLHFDSRAELLTPEMGTQAGTAQGTAQRTGKVFARFLDSIGAKVVNDEGEVQQIPFQQFGDELLDQAPTPYTGFMEVSTLGWAKGRSEMTVLQDLPLPMHLLSITRRHTANEG